MASFNWFLFAFLLSVSLVKDAHCCFNGDPTDGFVPVPLNDSNYHMLWPYDLPLSDRYSYVDGVRKLWVYSTDKPHSRNSKTKPRTEIGIRLINNVRISLQGLQLFLLFLYRTVNTTRGEGNERVHKSNLDPLYTKF